ncbi:MAG: hypothetical protein KBG04_07580 [Bacteroidales bacterium]|nr:hypothetical protein [Bacteroidales bacterium]
MTVSTIGILATFFGSVLLWFLNEKNKRIYEEYVRKEKKYSALIRSLKGFYEGTCDPKLINEFLNQLNLCWMYCPDEVIKKGYNFLHMVQDRQQDRQQYSEEDREKAIGELIIAIRKDLISRKLLKKTELKAEDFRHLGVNNNLTTKD